MFVQQVRLTWTQEKKEEETLLIPHRKGLFLPSGSKHNVHTHGRHAVRLGEDAVWTGTRLTSLHVLLFPSQIVWTAFVRAWSRVFGLLAAARERNVLLLLLADRRLSQSPCPGQGWTLESCKVQLSGRGHVLTRVRLLGCRRAAGCGGASVCVLVIVCV